MMNWNILVIIKNKSIEISKVVVSEIEQLSLKTVFRLSKAKSVFEDHS